MISNDYKTFGKLFAKHDIRGFLRNHGTTALNVDTDECLASVARDVFRNDDSEMKDIRLYRAMNKFSDALTGQYTNNTAVKKAVTTVDFLRYVCKIYNLLVVLKNHNRFREYKGIVDAINNVDILLKNLPNNINYDKLAVMLSESYLNAIIEVGCERTVAAISEETETEKAETN